MEKIEKLVNHLNNLSSGTLKHPATLQVLLESVAKGGIEDTLGDLAFDAKFCHKTHGIMQRIGLEGEGYDKLAAEFTVGIGRCREHLQQILTHLSSADRNEIEAKFLAMTPEGMQNLLALLHDLSWYKNYQIDTENRLS